MNALRSWLASEPVRLYLYGLLGPVLAVLAAYGVLDASEVALWAAVAVAVLAVPGVELARRRVSPSARPGDTPPGRHVDQ